MKPEQAKSLKVGDKVYVANFLDHEVYLATAKSSGTYDDSRIWIEDNNSQKWVAKDDIYLTFEEAKQALVTSLKVCIDELEGKLNEVEAIEEFEIEDLSEG